MPADPLARFGVVTRDWFAGTFAEPTPAQADAACIPAQGATAGQVVGCVQGVYDQSQTYTSHFSQHFWVKAYNTEKSSHGHVTFAKPGKMQWAYDDPAGNRVVSDGSVIKVYDAGNKQIDLGHDPAFVPLDISDAAELLDPRIGAR